MLVLETAKPHKFAETINEAIGVELDYSKELREMLGAPQHVTEMADDGGVDEADQRRRQIGERHRHGDREDRPVVDNEITR